MLGVVSGISRQCLMHILADLLSKITSCEQLKGDCTKSPSPRGGHLQVRDTISASLNQTSNVGCNFVAQEAKGAELRRGSVRFCVFRLREELDEC